MSQAVLWLKTTPAVAMMLARKFLAIGARLLSVWGPILRNRNSVAMFLAQFAAVFAIPLNVDEWTTRIALAVSILSALLFVPGQEHARTEGQETPAAAPAAPRVSRTFE